MSHKCEKCDKTFNTKEYLRKHNNRKTACNAVYNCEKCGKKFPNANLLKRHDERITPCAPETIPVITSDHEENVCHMCGKTYTTTSNLRRHQKSCTVKDNPGLITRLLDQNQELISIIKQNGLGNQINNNLIVNNNNNNLQQNMYVNLAICNFGNEDLSKLNQQDVIYLLEGRVEDFMIRMMDYIHANPKHPEFHNVFYDSVRKVALVYKQLQNQQSSWVSEDIEHVSKQITDKIKKHIQPLNSPYFNTLAQAKNTETANKIPQILYTDWDTPETVEDAKTCLSKVTKNEGFMDKVRELNVE